MSDNLREAALEYHRLPTHGKISVVPTKAMVTQRDLSLAYSPGVAEACNEIVRDPREAHTLTARGNLVGGRDQRHGGAGPGQHRSAGRQAGDGRQRVPVQEVRRHRRLRHRTRRARPGQAGRHHRRAGADLRRHQPRGHQGAGVLLHRAQAARAAEDPGVPRRPAWHRDRRRGRGAQRPALRRQGHRQGEAGVLGRGRRRDRLPRPAGEPRRAQARTSSSPTARACSMRTAPKAWTRARRATHARPRRARWPTRCPEPTSSSGCRGRAC